MLFLYVCRLAPLGAFDKKIKKIYLIIIKKSIILLNILLENDLNIAIEIVYFVCYTNCVRYFEGVKYGC